MPALGAGARPSGIGRALQTPGDSYLDSRHRRTMRLARSVVILAVLLGLCCWGGSRIACAPAAPEVTKPKGDPAQLAAARSIKVATFLGNESRDSYGAAPAPQRLKKVWRTEIGAGWTRRKSDEKRVLWSGTGWTGQCTVVEQDGKTWLLIGGYDHNLRRVDAATGKTLWKYKLDDVVKSTNTVFVNPNPTGDADRIIVAVGSRRGSEWSVGDPRVAPLRAVSFATGKELWRLPFPKSDNYSQDMDSSTLLVGDTLYAAIEPGYVLGLDPSKTKPFGEYRQPAVRYRSPRLYSNADARAHPDLRGANVAIEASPARLGETLYIASGAGHVFGLRLPDLKVVWDFPIGSDLDGTTVVTSDKKLLVPVERQYIEGHGGMFQLDPSKKPADAVEWFFPTADRGISEWKGGVIGSVATNDGSSIKGELPRLAAFSSVDGLLYVVSRDQMSSKKATGPDGTTKYPKPALVFSDHIGGATSTPIIVGDTIIAAGFDKKVHLYRISYQPDADDAKGVKLQSADGGTWRVAIKETSTFTGGGPFESTPIVWNGRVYIGCRDGFLYCLGD